MAGRALQMLARAQGGGEDNMDASKKVVDDLIAVLEQQGTEEAEKKKYCEAKLHYKNGDKTEVEDTLKSLEAEIDYKATEVESFENKVKSTEEAVAQMKENLEVAQGVRKAELKAYEASARDRTLAVKVLKQAKEVLRQFYETQDSTASNSTASSFLAQAHQQVPSSQMVCAEDVKVCADGSSVSRDAANGCEFPACPTEATSTPNLTQRPRLSPTAPARTWRTRACST